MSCSLNSRLILCSFLLIQLLTHIRLARGNGRLLEPPSRSSLWRSGEFKQFNPPVNYNDNHLDCGGALVPEDESITCGICGDSFSDPIPRPNEDGGEFSRGIIVRKYTPGQEIPVTVQLTYGQKGSFDFTLCARDGEKDHRDPACYGEHLLKIVPITEAAGKYYNLTVTLPSNVKCKNCVFRWRYRTANNWGECGNGKPGALGCGPQQSFHGCSDISIA